MAIFGKRPLLITVFGCVVDRASISLSIMITASKLSISTKLLILAGALRNALVDLSMILRLLEPLYEFEAA
jgi:hypothetical protein